MIAVDLFESDFNYHQQQNKVHGQGAVLNLSVEVDQERIAEGGKLDQREEVMGRRGA